MRPFQRSLGGLAWRQVLPSPRGLSLGGDETSRGGGGRRLCEVTEEEEEEESRLVGADGFRLSLDLLSQLTELNTLHLFWSIVSGALSSSVQVYSRKIHFRWLVELWRWACRREGTNKTQELCGIVGVVVFIVRRQMLLLKTWHDWNELTFISLTLFSLVLRLPSSFWLNRINNKGHF